MVQHNDQVDAASCAFSNVDPGWWEALSSARIRPTTTPALAKFLIDLGYTTGEFGKNHLGDHTGSLPTANGFQEYWGYLYHLDAMQGVSFPDNTLAAAFAALR